MGRRKKVVSPFAHLYHREPFFAIEGGRVIERGEVIKIKGVHGTKFMFKQYTRRNDTGIDWIDCYELDRGTMCGERSFRTDRIKPLPKTRRNKKIKNTDSQ